MIFRNGIFCVAPLAALLLFGCAKQPPSSEPPPVIALVKTGAVRAGNIAETVDATGSTAPLREAELRSPVTGVIVRFTLLNGNPVKHGQSVAVIRTRESQAAIQGAEQLLRSAATPEQKQEAQRALDLAQQSTHDIAITAPFDGVLTMKIKNQMEVVAEGEQLATVVDLESIVFYADVPISQSGRVKVGEPASIRFSMASEDTIYGTVRQIESQANTADQTVRVQIQLRGETPALDISQFGYASIVVGTHSDVLLVPVAALLRNDEDNSSSVMIVSDSLACSVPVVVGIVRNSLAEVSSPDLKAGMRVITEGHYGLPDSTRVRVSQ
jgi:multidrug efflux pump subunit AcrA (membrane-fusion protein)